MPYRDNTPQEKLLKRVIEESGLSYEYQVHVDPYTLDFYIPELHVAVEADGVFGHLQKKDAERTDWLRTHLKEMRVWRIKEQTLGGIREEFQALLDEENRLAGIEPNRD